MKTAGGESRFMTRKPIVVSAYLIAGGVDSGLIRPMKLSGVQRRPIMNDREKLMVARAERKRPKRRRENDLIRRYC